MAESLILHSDLNCFYASVEINEHPELRGKCVAVCGSVENRHGIVLTKSYEAKKYGVKTGEANWQAMEKCPHLICVPPHYELYLKYSKLVRQIYARYTDVIEPFGMDENWLSIPLCHDIEKEGWLLANEIRRKVRSETGLTVSIGVSFSKIFAKLGSDMKKPDAITVISRENYQQKVWPLPAGELLYVGPSTVRRLASMNIKTIGELAMYPPSLLLQSLGKNGLMLSRFANGEDHTPVMPSDYVVPIQSVGHGITCVCDLERDDQVWRVLYELAQDMGHRMRKNQLAATGIQLQVRDTDLKVEQYQMQIGFATRSPLEMAQMGYALFCQRWSWEKNIRSITLRGIQLVPEQQEVQMDLFGYAQTREKQRKLDDAIDEIRKRFGNQAIRAASLMQDLNMAQDHCEMVIMPGAIYQAT